MNHHISSFVIRNNNLQGSRKKDYQELAPNYLLPLDNNIISWSTLFPEAKEYIVEIGFGMGDATWQIAQANPDKAYIAIEVYRPGIVKLMRSLKANDINNVRIIEGDALEVFRTMLEPACLAGVHIFFPDPWPKAKHHKRRLLTTTFLDFSYDFLQDNGYIYFVTDWYDYALWALKHSRTSKFNYESEDFSNAQSWRPMTNFERKGLNKSHVIKELLLQKGQI